MPVRLHPGVYVEEVPSAARSIEAAGTSTAIFVGETERGPLEPTRITGLAEYERLFGGYRRHAAAGAQQIASVSYAIDAFFRNGGSAAYVLRALNKDAKTAALSVKDTGQEVVASSPGAWGNQVSAVFCTSGADTSRFRIVVLYKAPGTKEVRIVETWDRLSVLTGDENYVVDILKRSLFVRWGSGTPTAIPADFLKSPANDKKVIEEFDNFALQGGSLGETDLDEVSFPTLLSRLDEVNDASLLVVPARPYDLDANNLKLGQVALSYAESRPHQDLFCIVDMPLQKAVSADEATNKTVTSFGNLNPTNMGAVYFPWVEVGDPAGVGREPTLLMPPSGFVAGVYARTDSRRGVWKAPAGLDATLLGVRKLQQKLLDSHQDVLNPLGVNVLRLLPAAGAVVWGARTLQPASEWRYVPVRRMAIFLRKSIYNSIQWAVFEPNDETLWSSLRFSISSFMEQLLRQGAFAGKTAPEAFFVKCDAETTPEADQIAGIVNVWVGFAPLRPAEFVVVKLSQMVNQKS